MAISSRVGWRIAAAALLSAAALLLASCGGSTTEDPPPLPPCPTVAGTWSGTLAEATSGSFGEAVIALEQTGCTLSGNWNARFNSGTVNSGTISGTVVANTQVIDLRLTSTALNQCPLSVTVSVLNGEAQGTYASVNCPVLLAGNVHVYRDAPAGPGYHPGVPGTPSGVVATPGDGQVTLRWTKVFGASAHNVYWSTNPGVTPATGTKVAQVNEPATISGLTNSIPYYFVVTAENADGEGAASEEVGETPFVTAPNAPAGVVAAPSVGQATVTWPAVYGATGYNLYWSTIPDQAFSAGTQATGVSSPYLLAELTNGSTYFIAVTATYAGTESAPSIEARATPYSSEGYNFEDGTLQGWTATGGWAVTSSVARSGAYSVTDSPAGDYANGSDSSLTSLVFNFAGRYAYVVNSGSNNVSQYAIGPNGALTAMSPATVTAGSNPRSIAVDPTGRYAYVANGGSNTVSQYVIGTDGALAPITPATIAAGSYPQSVAIDPAGRYVYVANHGNDNDPTCGCYRVGGISKYAIGANGALAHAGYVEASSGQQPSAVAIHPSGRYVYAANGNNDSVTQYVSDSGVLTAAAKVSAGRYAQSITVDPSGKYAYVANSDYWYGGNISQYAIGASGALLGFATVVAGRGSYSVAVDSSGRYAYVANIDSDNVSQYTIGANGALTPMAPATVASGIFPSSITIDPSGRYVYVTDASSIGSVSQYTIGANGALTPMTSATVAAGRSPMSLAIARYNSSPVLTFWHRYELEFGHDFGRVEISSDAGATWTTLRTFTGSQSAWTAETIGLRDYAAQEVLIRFRLTADGSGTADGWYLDDIVIYK